MEAEREPSVSVSDVKLTLEADNRDSNSAASLETEISWKQVREIEEDKYVHIHQIPSEGKFVD